MTLPANDEGAGGRQAELLRLPQRVSDLGPTLLEAAPTGGADLR